ncbi:MAG: hypothetical protein V5A84_03745 [Planctomycetota bacterium]
MVYLVAFQLLCGCFAGYVAAQKRRNWFWWFLVGTLVPVAGVLIALMVDSARAGRGGRSRGRSRDRGGEKLKRPKRCCGEYIPDCKGCPYFSRPLFDGSYRDEKKGYCKFFKKELIEKKEEDRGRVIIRGREEPDRAQKEE